MQDLSTRSHLHIWVVAELLGDDSDGERNIDSEGRVVKHIAPWTDRLVRRISTLKGTTDRVEGLLKGWTADE